MTRLVKMFLLFVEMLIRRAMKLSELDFSPFLS
jgi:hypothetical protein